MRLFQWFDPRRRARQGYLREGRRLREYTNALSEHASNEIRDRFHLQTVYGRTGADAGRYWESSLGDYCFRDSAVVSKRHRVAHYHRATSATHFWPTSGLWRSGIRRWGRRCPACRAEGVCRKRMSGGTRVGTGYTMELQQ